MLSMRYVRPLDYGGQGETLLYSVSPCLCARGMSYEISGRLLPFILR